jgi:hypothetical protein
MFERKVKDDIPSLAVTYPSDNVEINEITDRTIARKQEIRYRTQQQPYQGRYK